MMEEHVVPSREAARHICQEARVVLCSLRGGPPAVARGDLAQDLQGLCVVVRSHLVAQATAINIPPTASEPNATQQQQQQEKQQEQQQKNEEGRSTPAIISREESLDIVHLNAQDSEPESSVLEPLLPPQQQQEQHHPQQQHQGMKDISPLEAVGPFARPFLAVVMDPRAAGPHTLVALRALFRLLSQSSLRGFPVSLPALLRGVLQCKFEQTDAGADEAVEMAIADVLSLLVAMETYPPNILMDAFNTVFVTRNTFVHSPALCYHFEDVLSSMIKSVFDRRDLGAKLLLEFLVNQLLHTPLTAIDDEAARDAQIAHDATRVLCLKLARTCIGTNWENPDPYLLRIIQDDLCLSLLMTGQAIWSYAPGLVSMDVLSEICATLSALWNTPALRVHLVDQFETIFTGFYQRSLVLLRKRQNPSDSTSFNINLVFDSELEVILESLVDLLCLQDDSSTLETLFATYDCHLGRSDVAEHLIVELCRCCGAVVDDEGAAMLTAWQVLDDQSRPVPPHLKELCAEALLGSLKTLFQEAPSTLVSEQRATRRSKFLMSMSDAMKSVILDVPPPPDLDLASPLTTELKRTSSKSVDTNHMSHRGIKSRKRMFRKAAKMFNDSSRKGIGFLVEHGLIEETPPSVATFLRNGLVLGLDKAAVGQYLGELGKAPAAGKSPHSWERDWFHAEVLKFFCSLFRFENQSLLDGLRMFLASFRLPGEGQQIDRVIQAFADSCGSRCDDIRYFSDDPKRAADAAFLLAYSIIMLNTDQHNPQIREDKKMSLEAFIRNNTDYGRDITEKGKEFPRDFLAGIYESIREEEIRTEKDGAEGHMTIERWKDILRGTTVSLGAEASGSDCDDLKELVMESFWSPIVSAVGAFWGVIRPPIHQEGMLSAQGARLGMDLSLELLGGVRNLARVDIFQHIFSYVCDYTGLLGDYRLDTVDRTSNFVLSVEAQSAVAVAIQTAHDAGDEIGLKGWKQIWGLVFELRDLKMLGGGKNNWRRSLFCETEPDFLSEQSRREWTMILEKGFVDTSLNASQSSAQPSSFLGGLGKALFGSDELEDQAGTDTASDAHKVLQRPPTAHGKEEFLVWDELAPSDDEDDEAVDDETDKDRAPLMAFASAGTQFESQLIHEDILIQNQTNMPVTGLERMEDTRPHQISPRARVRKRLARVCDFSRLVSESRFMDINGTRILLTALVELVKDSLRLANKGPGDENTPPAIEDGVISTCFPLSPASEALAEILLCEISLKNRDRLGSLWAAPLKQHYSERLSRPTPPPQGDGDENQLTIDPGIEKCVTGLLRLCACAASREDVANDLIGTLPLVFGPSSPKCVLTLDKHIGEGLWRICQNESGLQQLGDEGWNGLLGLAEVCAKRGAKSVFPDPKHTNSRSAGLADDDSAFQAYRSIHLVLHSPELNAVVPIDVIKAIEALIRVGGVGHCPKLCLASLDLLHTLRTRYEIILTTKGSSDNYSPEKIAEILGSHWTRILKAIASSAEESADSIVRQHAVSILADAFLDKHAGSLPSETICTALPTVCIPLAGKRIGSLILDEGRVTWNIEHIMIEFEQCMSLIFKPLLFHLKRIVEDKGNLLGTWKALLEVMENLLGEEQKAASENIQVDGRGRGDMTPEKMRHTLKNLASEHLRNAIMMLNANGVLTADESNEISALTWAAISRMTFCKEAASEWRDAVQKNKEN